MVLKLAESMHKGRQRRQSALSLPLLGYSTRLRHENIYGKSQLCDVLNKLHRNGDLDVRNRFALACIRDCQRHRKGLLM